MFKKTAIIIFAICFFATRVCAEETIEEKKKRIEDYRQKSVQTRLIAVAQERVYQSLIQNLERQILEMERKIKEAEEEAKKKEEKKPKKSKAKKSKK